jgi:RNA polymerase sigma-70 factor, ECF subfamily
MGGQAVVVGGWTGWTSWALREAPRERSSRVWELLVRRGAGEEPGVVLTGPAEQSMPDAAGREVDGGVLRRAQRGDHGAFHQIVDHYEGRLRVLAYGLLRDSDQMNDALQDTFVKAWAALPEFRGEAALGTWLHRICYRVCLDDLRKQRVRPAGETLAEDLADPADEAEGLALREQVSEALGRLPAEQRAVLLLVDREGYDYGTVAVALEVPVGTVASRLSLARAAMRRALRLDESGEEVAR